MTPSRLAFVQEFERQLNSYPLRQWFELARSHEAGLHAFIDPESLRRFLHSEEADCRKPEIWRGLVRSLQLHQAEGARLFVLGLLEPVLGHLMDNFGEVELEPNDLWQEIIACALQALANPRLPERRQVLAGLVKDTYKYLCIWLRREFAKAEGEAPLLDQSYDVNFDEALDGIEGQVLLAEWCRRAGVTSRDRDLIFATRIGGIPLSQLAPARTRPYNRWLRRRDRAERRLSLWLRRKESVTENHGVAGSIPALGTLAPPHNWFHLPSERQAQSSQTP